MFNIDKYEYIGDKVKERLSKAFKTLGDATRLEILELLVKGETCGCTLINQLPISQPTLSYHLKKIKDAGLTETNRDGTWIKHKISKKKLDELINYLTLLRDGEEETCKY
jgi:ArsR family transcriptional regulator